MNDLAWYQARPISRVHRVAPPPQKISPSSHNSIQHARTYRHRILLIHYIADPSRLRRQDCLRQRYLVSMSCRRGHVDVVLSHRMSFSMLRGIVRIVWRDRDCSVIVGQRFGIFSPESGPSFGLSGQIYPLLGICSRHGMSDTEKNRSTTYKVEMFNLPSLVRSAEHGQRTSLHWANLATRRPARDSQSPNY